MYDCNENGNGYITVLFKSHVLSCGSLMIVQLMFDPESHSSAETFGSSKSLLMDFETELLCGRFKQEAMHKILNLYFSFVV